MASQPPQPRRFKLVRPRFTRHYDIKADDGTDNKVYVVDISTMTPNKPDVTLHAGPDLKTAPIVAVCHIPKGSRRSYKLGVGDPSRDPSGVMWEDMRRNNIRGSDVPWEFYVPARGGRVRLSWKHSSNVAVEGMKPSMMNARNNKLVDTDTGEVVAIFTRTHGWSSCGVFQINVQWGEQFEHAVLMTSVALYEKKRRRNASNAAAAGSG